jgi:hypothetical protein
MADSRREAISKRFSTPVFSAIPAHEAEASHYECLPPRVGEAQGVMNHVTPSSSLLP